MGYKVRVCRRWILSRTAGRMTNPREHPRSYLQWWLLRLAGSRQKRKPSVIFPRQLRRRLPLHLVSPDRTKVRELNSTLRGGGFPKEFAINASSPHCASICFRLSTRGRLSRSVVVETNIRTPRAVCDFLRSCVFLRKWRRIDRVYRDLSRSWIMTQRFVFRRFHFVRCKGELVVILINEITLIIKSN